MIDTVVFRYSLLRIHPVVFVILLLTTIGCIERYYPDEEDLETGTLVVVAHLSSIPGTQSVYLSRSTSLQRTKFDPVTGCFLEVERSDGAVKVMEESEPGEYSAFMDADFLRSGSDYRLIFIVPSGERYESCFEKMLPSPVIEQLTHEIEVLHAADPDDSEEGIRFYIDFDIEKDSSRYLRWQLIETYEIENPDYPVQMFDVDRRMKDVPDSIIRRRCWITGEIPRIFTMDLGNVEGSTYRRMALHFVSAHNRRLEQRYSLLVRQLSLTPSAFWYWNELGKNLQSMGTLFDAQPSLTPGNICNSADEDERIIGFFSISGATEMRVFVDFVPGLNIRKDPYLCAPGEFPMFLNRYPLDKLPIFLATASLTGVTKTGLVDRKCVDCREYKNSTDIKPDFW